MNLGDAILSVLFIAVLATIVLAVSRAVRRQLQWRRTVERLENGAWRRVLDELRSS